MEQWVFGNLATSLYYTPSSSFQEINLVYTIFYKIP